MLEVRAAVEGHTGRRDEATVIIVVCRRRVDDSEQIVHPEGRTKRTIRIGIASQLSQIWDEVHALPLSNRTYFVNTIQCFITSINIFHNMNLIDLVEIDFH